MLASRVPRIVERAKARTFGGAVPKGRYPALICSLTRTAAAEIASRCPDLPQEAIGTIHAHAYRSQGCPPVIEATDIEEWNTRHPAYALSKETESVEEVMKLRHTASPGDTYMQEYNLLRNRMTTRDLWAVHVVAFARRWEDWKREIGKIDYVDMLEYASTEPPGAPDVIILDEAQDTSRLAYRVLERWAERTRSMWIVGDPWQSLYEWSGADPSLLQQDLPGDHKGTLSQSYRVPQAVHERAVEWARQLSDWAPIEYAPRNAPGEIKTCRSTWANADEALCLAVDYASCGKSVMLACSTNHQAGTLVRQLRKKGIPFSNPWRLQDGGWNPLAPRRGVTAARGVSGLLRDKESGSWSYADVHAFTKLLRADGILRRGAKKHIEARKDSDDTVELADLWAWFEESALDELIESEDRLEWLQRHVLPSRAKTVRYPIDVARNYGVDGLTTQQIYVGTIHSFKGAEADVVILFPDLSSEAYREWQRGRRDPIVRMFYVAMTRARETLVLCQAATRKAVRW